MAQISIDPDLLRRLGYRNLTRQQAVEALNEIYEALEYTVGMRIAAQMTTRQLDDFEDLVNSGPEERALAWLAQHFPHYRVVVADEFDALQRRLEGAIRLARSRSKQDESRSEYAK